jgi:hypothetical protein
MQSWMKCLIKESALLISISCCDAELMQFLIQSSVVMGQAIIRKSLYVPNNDSPGSGFSVHGMRLIAVKLQTQEL